MAEEKFDPAEHTAAEVKEVLKEATPEEKAEIVVAERAGDARRSVIKAAGEDPDVRTDASGRVLNPWEVSPGKTQEITSVS